MNKKNLQVLTSHIKKIFFVFVIGGLLIQASKAEQISFSKILVDKNYQFNYQWQDHLDQQQSLNFSFPAKTIFNRYRDFSIYQPSLAQEYVNKKLRRHFKKVPIKGVRVFFKKEADGFQINIKSRDEQAIQETSELIIKLQEDFHKEYLEKKYYHEFITPDNISAVKPNHGLIAIESVNDFRRMKSIILKQSSIKNIRKVTNYVLGFIQNIPYSTLESRVTSSGAGFNPPLKLLFENQGDCDSKVTLTISLLRTLMPRIKMALIYIDNHALLGINIKPEGDDITVIDNDITYVLAEPTGPSLFALGEVAEDSEQAIYNGHYTIEPFHSQVKADLPEDVSEFEDKVEESSLEEQQ